MYVSFLGTSSPEARSVCWALVVMSPYGLGSRDASSRFDRDRRSRQLAAGWQTKGADIHSLKVIEMNLRGFPENVSMEGIYEALARLVIKVDNTGTLVDAYQASFTHPEFGRLADKYVRL